MRMRGNEDEERTVIIIDELDGSDQSELYGVRKVVKVP